jgi:uncharacterized Tic20 family protein
MSLKESCSRWYEIHSSDKDEVGFQMAITFAGMMIAFAIIFGAITLGATYPLVGNIELISVIGISICSLLYYVFSIRDEEYKPKKDPLDKKQRAKSGTV